MVIKYGGNAMKSLELRRAITQEISTLRSHLDVVIVHGGGPVIEQNLQARNITSEFKRGLRVTTPEIMDVTEQALTRLSKELSQDLENAIGLSGRDMELLVGQTIAEDLGRAGRINTVNTDLLRKLLGAGITPVIACVGIDENGEALNVNADWAAGAVAGALNAPILYLTDVDGVYTNYPDPASLAPQLTRADIEKGIQDGWIAGGMIPKVEAALHALDKGAPSATISSGMRADVLVEAVFGQSGTKIVP
ncbi:acetylglutamate kinase [Deinococcus roseus]|uniref:acetylglutamate kinase n=1 Tax=Deinococcus roseus TaxID=392414 RepID=UPI001665B8D2|nr:acetylglutamate kinase [Deinococcus roseus]